MEGFGFSPKEIGAMINAEIFDRDETLGSPMTVEKMCATHSCDEIEYRCKVTIYKNSIAFENLYNTCRQAELIGMYKDCFYIKESDGILKIYWDKE